MFILQKKYKFTYLVASSKHDISSVKAKSWGSFLCACYNYVRSKKLPANVCVVFVRTMFTNTHKKQNNQN